MRSGIAFEKISPNHVGSTLAPVMFLSPAIDSIRRFQLIVGGAKCPKLRNGQGCSTREIRQFKTLRQLDVSSNP